MELRLIAADVFRAQAGQLLRRDLKIIPMENTPRALWYFCTVVLYNLHKFRIFTFLLKKQTTMKTNDDDGSIPTGLTMDKQQSNRDNNRNNDSNNNNIQLVW